MAGYVRLAAEARHPVFDEVLRRVMRQEGTLSTGADGVAVAERIDRRVDGEPGLEGMGRWPARSPASADPPEPIGVR